jgi:hypothetical protein
MIEAKPIQHRLHCRACGVLLSQPLAEMVDAALLRFEYGDSAVPRGWFIRSDSLDAAGRQSVGVEANEIVVNTMDLDRTMSSETQAGCCGPGGRNGPNRVCSNGHEVGTELGDCWQVQFTRLPLASVEVRASQTKSVGWRAST